MSQSISIRRALVAALAAGALLAALPGAAGAAVPETGYYSGTTSQQLSPSDQGGQPRAGSISLKVFKYGSSDGPGSSSTRSARRCNSPARPVR